MSRGPGNTRGSGPKTTGLAIITSLLSGRQLVNFHDFKATGFWGFSSTENLRTLGKPIAHDINATNRTITALFILQW